MALRLMAMVVRTQGVELGKVYELEQMQPRWLRLLRCPSVQYPLPTQVVVREPGYYSPRYARAYRTELSAVTAPSGRTVVMDDADLRASAERVHGVDTCNRPGDGPLAKPDRVLMLEVWEDGGSEGHVDFMLE